MLSLIIVLRYFLQFYSFLFEYHYFTINFVLQEKICLQCRLLAYFVNNDTTIYARGFSQSFVT